MTDPDAASGWSYRGRTGPDYWSSLSESFHTCETGQRQSPIDITGYETGAGESLRFFYGSLPVAVNNNGRTVTAWYERGSSMTVGDKVFQLVQAHYHAPSEHLIEGRQFAAEIHLLHEDREGSLAVVASLLEFGQPNPVLDSLLRSVDSEDAPYGTDPALHSRVLKPCGTGYYYYIGSTTTPPCLEPVEWFVMEGISTVFEDQLAALQSATGGPNNRPIQPLNGRAVRRVA